MGGAGTQAMGELRPLTTTCVVNVWAQEDSRERVSHEGEK